MTFTRRDLSALPQHAREQVNRQLAERTPVPMRIEQHRKAFTVRLDVRANPLDNARGHWRTRAGIVKRLRETTANRIALQLRLTPCSCPARVTLTRHGKRRLDSDGIPSACKPIRDGIAQAFGVDDGDARWDWQYRQETGGDYGVTIHVEPLPPGWRDLEREGAK